MTIEAALSQEQPADPALQADRRGAERYPCDLQPFWRIVGEDHADAPPASIQDVSATGIGLRVRQGSSQGPFWSSRYKRGTTVFPARCRFA